MLTESFVAATLTANKPVAHASAALKDVGIFVHEFQPQTVFRHGFKKSSSQPGSVAISDSHIYSAQADKAAINVYSRKQGNQEATVPFPEKIRSLAYANRGAILVIGTEEGRLICWEVATGRLTTSATAHLQSVSSLVTTPNNEYIISGSADASVHVWSLLALVSFEQPRAGFDEESTSLHPLSTFSNHRSGITALASGHAASSSNIAVSASKDKTCYIWHIESAQILRTVLLPFESLSIVLDPADRAVYFGGIDGNVASYDVFDPSSQTRRSLRDSIGASPVQLRSKDNWVSPDSGVGPTHSLTLSYDGTTLLSGHENGSIIRWDVAKRRVFNEITNLGQPVTNLEMLEPDGWPNSTKITFEIPKIVKPNLEFSAQTDNGSLGIPARYNLNVQITTPRFQPGLQAENEVIRALTGSGIPQNILDDALRAIDLGGSGIQFTTSDSSADVGKIERLEDEITKLKTQVAALQEVDERRTANKMARIEKREELSQKKREAYFAAKKKGKDGDAAMKKWEEKEMMLDIESDNELRGDKMDTG